MIGSAATPGSQFYGLFIGVDRYQSDRIGNLASAVRDAEYFTRSSLTISAGLLLC